MIPVIICGGWGTKMWPISRQFKPKHFINLLGDKSLFKLNYEALRTKFKPEEIFISTNNDQVSLAKEQAPEIPDENYILEPEMRNTGPAIGLIAATLYKKGYQDEPFMILQADVLREPADKLIKMMMDCDSLARKDTKYITGGLKPDYAVMGVDYLVKGDRVSSSDEVGIFKVDQFVWRSSKEQTEEFIKKDNALIHTNHSCMTPKNYLNLLKEYRQDWYEPLMNIVSGQDVRTEFVKMPPGVQEEFIQKVHEDGKSLVVEVPFKWFDFGTYESIYKYLHEKGLYKAPENVVEYESNDNFVRLDDPNKVICIVGLNNIVVIDTGDVVLICDKSKTGLIGDTLKVVKERHISLT